MAPFVPKDDLTPAEERAQYIMLPEGVAGEGGGGGGGSKQLTVFSEKGLLLGFYDEASKQREREREKTRRLSEENGGRCLGLIFISNKERCFPARLVEWSRRVV